MKTKHIQTQPSKGSIYDDRIDILFRELELANRWKRPSILLAVFSSHHVHGEVESALKNRLLGVNQDVHCFKIDEEKTSDLPQYLTNLEHLDQKVIFVEGFDTGGGKKDVDAYRTLNFSRDYFINRKVRVVFWLTSEEANDLARFAPEFWGYRHRVVEFLDQKDSRQSPLQSLGSVWQGIGEYSNGTDAIDEKISLRNVMLADLPDMDESTSAKANLFISLGILHWRKGEIEKALANSNKALELASKLDNQWFEAFCYNSIALIQANTGKVSESIKALQQATKLVPDQPFSYNNLGNLFSELDRFDEAMVAFRTVIQKNPHDPMSLNGMGTVYFKQGKTKEAYRNFTKAIQAAPTLPHPWIGLGNIYDSQNQTEAAISAYQKAIDLDQNLALPWINLGSLFEKLNRMEDAAQAFQKAFDLDPSNPVTWNAQGKIYLNTGCFDEAVCAFQKSIELDHGNGWSYVDLAQTYVCKGKYDEAIKLYHQSIRLFKTPSEKAITWSKLGNIYQLKNDIKNAMAAKKIALELDPDLKQLKDELLEIHNALKSNQVSESQELVSMPSMEDTALGRFLQGETPAHPIVIDPSPIAQQGSYPQDTSPSSAFTWNERGNKHLNNHEVKKAEAAYKKAIELDDSYGWPYANLASIAVQREKFDEALPLYHQSLKHLKTSWEKAVIWNRLGNTYRKQNDFKKAIQAHRKALELDPKNIPSLQDLVRIHNDLEQVGDTISQLTNSMDKAVAWDMLGNAYRSLSDYEAAKEAFQNAVDLAPNDFAYRFDLEEARKACENQPSRARNNKKKSGSHWLKRLIKNIQEMDLLPSLKTMQPGPLGELIEIRSAQHDNQGKASSAFPIGGPSTGDTRSIDQRILQPEVSLTGWESVPPFLQKAASKFQNMWPPKEKTDAFPQSSSMGNPDRKFTSIQQDGELISVGSGFDPVKIHTITSTYNNSSLSASSTRTIPSQNQERVNNAVATYPMADTITRTPPWNQNMNSQKIERDIIRYQTVTGINPQNARAWYTLGDLLRLVGRLDEAVAALERAVEIDPNKDVYLYHLGKAYASQFRIEEAIDIFKKVVSINPEYTLAHATIAGFYLKLGKKKEYRHHMAIARNTMADEQEYNQACLEALCGNTDRAVELLKVALQKKQVSMEWVQRDPDFDGIRNEPAFKKMVAG